MADGNLNRGKDWVLIIGGTRVHHVGYTIRPRADVTQDYSAAGAAQTGQSLDDGCDIEVTLLSTDADAKSAWNAQVTATKEALVAGTETNTKYGITNRFRGVSCLPIDSSFSEGQGTHTCTAKAQHYDQE